jgi:anaerobic ribonucleoside-triphosphate reductase activating protein
VNIIVNTINLIGYNSCSLADGEGVREVIYISQCTHKCLGCQNKEYWADKGDEHLIDKVVDKLTKNPITNITISGGDGLTVQYENTLELLKRLRKKSNKNIWIYTGYTWEQLISSNKKEILKYIDVLVDGKFEIDKRDITLTFKGSSNQRIINVQKSLQKREVILYNE